jgi:AcrR family transcriptional regulator
MPRSVRAHDGSTKGERTRRLIVERAAAVFNTRGVAGASMADITAATGLEKGGVYNHFASKDDLALAAFDYAAGVMLARSETAAATATTPLARLRAQIDVFRDLARKPQISGGCPLLNTAIESDDTNPALRARVRAAFERWHRRLATSVADAVRAGALRATDAEAFATVAIAALEGGVMLAYLYRDPLRLLAVVDHLHRTIDGLVPD